MRLHTNFCERQHENRVAGRRLYRRLSRGALAAIPDVELHAVCDQSRFRREQVAKKYAIPYALSSSRELAASECDAVRILLPPALHLDAAFEMVEAGKSVFLEKPMGLSSAACAALCDRATKKGVAVGVSHNFLFSKSYEDLRRSVKSGELGRIDHLAVSWHFGLPILQFGPYDNWMLSAPANLMFELGSHLAALIVDLIGLPDVTTVSVHDPFATSPAQGRSTGSGRRSVARPRLPPSFPSRRLLDMQTA